MNDSLKTPAVELTLFWPAAKRRVILDLAQLDPGMIRVLFKLKPEILEARFYVKSVQERLIEIDHRKILETHGDLHKPFQTPDLNILSAEISPHDPMFEPNRLGNPREPEVVVKWLGNLAAHLKRATDKRNNVRLQSLAVLDNEIFGWVSQVAKAADKDPDRFLTYVQDEDGVDVSYRVDVSSLPLKGVDAVREKALKKRLEELCKTEGVKDVDGWLRLQYPLRTVINGANARIAKAKLQKELEAHEPTSLPEVQLHQWAFR